MGTFHVVGVYLQLGLGQDLRVIRKEDIAVGLEGFRLLAFGGDYDLAVEIETGTAGCKGVEKLVRGAVRTEMVHVDLEGNAVGTGLNENA